MSAIIFLCFVACLCIYICILLSLSKWNGIQANQPRQLCGQPASTLLTCRTANPFLLLLFNVFGVFLVVAVIGCCCCCFCCRYCFFFFFLYFTLRLLDNVVVVVLVVAAIIVVVDVVSQKTS